MLCSSADHDGSRPPIIGFDAKRIARLHCAADRSASAASTTFIILEKAEVPVIPWMAGTSLQPRALDA